MSGHGEKLTRREEQAIAALLSEPTIAAAAAGAGVAPATLRRWLAAPGFRARYGAARAEVVRVAVARLQAVMGKAATTLEAVMDDGGAPASSRVAAARAVFDLGLRAKETEELEARLAELERHLGVNDGGKP